MRINELLVEEQVDEISLAGIGRGIGKAVGGVAKGVGAVAGGIAGIPGAVKKGFQAGKAVVSGDDEADAQANAPAANPNAPAAAPAAGSINYQSAVANKASAAPSGTPAATANTGTTPPAGNTATPPASAGGTAPAADATKAAKVGVPAGKAAVDQAVNVVQSVRSDRRQDVVKYAKDKIDALAKAPAPAAAPAGTPPAAAPAKTPAAPVTPPEEDNPNIVKGYNENVDRILYLSKVLNVK